MKKIFEYMWIEFKVQFRVPISIFFTLFFPLMLLVVFVVTNSNKVITGNIHYVDIYLPIMMLLALFSSGIISFSVIIAGNRNKKIWQIYRLRGFKLYQIIIVQLLVNIIIALVSIIILVIVANIIFNANIPSPLNLLEFFGVWLVIAISVFLIGFVIGVFCNNEKVAQSISTPIMFILMFFSGIIVDQSVYPKIVQTILLYLPTNQANNILIKSWSQVSENQGQIYWGVIIGWIVISLCFVFWKLYREDFKRI